MNNDTVTDLSEDMEVIGPGRMLIDGREKLGLSRQNVAERLNFRLALVSDIENEVFDKSLPATYNRGYLKSYAKLVNISGEDVLAAYDMLGVAQLQGAEMQSFSKITKKQTQNTWLMLVSYFVLATLIGSTVMLMMQNDTQESEVPVLNKEQTLADNYQTENVIAADKKNTAPLINNTASQSKQLSLDTNTTTNTAPVPVQANENVAQNIVVAPIKADSPSTDTSQVSSLDEPVAVIFDFSEDCWVNIFDAKGERIAWGIKKAGYQMTITALAPLSVTLGKPELVEIVFDGEEVDMTQFIQGNIAKFTLPVTPSQ